MIFEIKGVVREEKSVQKMNAL